MAAPARHRVAADHPAFAGHFPGRPIWPGVALLAEVLEVPQLAVVKFLAPVRPGAMLEISFQIGTRSASFSVTDSGQPAASGQLMRVDASAGVAP